MIRLPVFTALKVSNYGLFPGEPHGSGIDWSFQSGLSLIAGINGLGKTTLLNMILRSLTGPYDLTGTGPGYQQGSVQQEKPVPLTPQAKSFFAQRVADGAKDATVTLSALFGVTTLTVTRRLNDLSLVSCLRDDIPIPSYPSKDDSEKEFQNIISELMVVGSFVDVLLLLHHVVLFHEDRPGALWDKNAQRHILRALFLAPNDANKLAELERNVESADSKFRNIQWQANSTEKELNRARQREAGSQGVLAHLEVEQKLLEADLEEIVSLESELSDLDTFRQQFRLEHERAKLKREEANSAIERLKYTALLRLFPSMDDAARLVVSRIMTENRCLVCNAEASAKRAELEMLIAHGCCPSCGAEPARQANIVAQHEFEQANLDRARELAELTRQEEDARLEQLHSAKEGYEKTLAKIVQLRSAVEERTRKTKGLRAQLPSSMTSQKYEIALEALRGEKNEWDAKRAEHYQNLRQFFASKEGLITAQSDKLVQTFASLIKELIAEDARLVQETLTSTYMQGGRREDGIRVPAYAAEMTAANHPSYVRRNNPSDVSESQRELVDLAFRLALVKVATSDGACTFVMETPEASLDGVAMERVGCALARFASTDDNRLIVTSNLSNTGLITSLFGGPVKIESENDERLHRVLNLLSIAAPNRALLQDREKYHRLLLSAISGANS
ncbi:hypothetical protein [Methylomonas sp. UP202]|uniref:hypothetical protein n=1 Tax=Methylomonas sp. UP202 TaxID=3040943 RepID=UPI00247AFCBF|nr:hypothetical protein [Methylomonas sp. UP202]WGS84108.1 hypothetical protein QC632_13710 [Methylomonas sp. UP202]